MYIKYESSIVNIELQKRIKKAGLELQKKNYRKILAQIEEGKN